jgi:uncharacterized metal-binding protein YceD (DUF177 family)
MTKHKAPPIAPAPTTPALWQIPATVETVPEDGRRFDLVADDATRAAIAKVASVRELPRLEAHFDVTRRGAGGLHITGLVSGTVGQNCVVTLEPLTSAIEEKVDVVFLPEQALARPKPDDDEDDKELREVKWDDPEPLIGGTVDLGTLAIEFLIVGIDPYPRKAGAVFDPPPEDKAGDSPFAGLAKLKSQAGGEG